VTSPPRHACRLAFTLLKTQQRLDEQRYRRGSHQRERWRLVQLCRTTAQRSLSPARPRAAHGAEERLPLDGV
jgi:hypothetical protein